MCARTCVCVRVYVCEYVRVCINMLWCDVFMRGGGGVCLCTYGVV